MSTEFSSELCALSLIYIDSLRESKITFKFFAVIELIDFLLIEISLV